MADTRSVATARRFATAILPWVIGGCALLWYGLTLNRWVSPLSLPVVSRICGWDWQTQLQHPVGFAVTYPLRLLAPNRVPVAANVFAAVCAALALALLARSVAIWPQDRTRPQWLREEDKFGVLSIRTAWLPPLLAALACGLQLTFWEHATSAGGEMVDLLIFAWVVRALLEYRITHKPAWLSSAAFFYAAGMADNWTLIAYLPAFLVALLWLKGFGLFEPRFLARMCVWAAAGLCLYLLLPLIHSRSSANHVDFWLALKGNLRIQKNSLSHFPRATFAALAFTVGIPLLAMAICWRGRMPNFADDSLVGSILAKGVFHVGHAVFLLFSIWLMLDSPFSPRQIGFGLPLLTQYYLSSLVIGYCAGYFLLLGTVEVPKYVALPTLGLLGLLACAVPAALIWRNLHQIQMTNSPVLHEFARQLYDGLPRGKSVVLSDERALPLLLLVRAEVAGHPGVKEPLMLDTRALMLGEYQRYLAREFKSRWPYPAPSNGVAILDPIKAVAMVSRLEGQQLYLHPSFSYYLERFQQEPHQAVVWLMQPAAGGSGELLPQAFAANERYWQALWTNSLRRLAAAAAPPGAATKIERWLRLTPGQNVTVALVSSAMSRSLDYWGVCAQRLGHWNEAGVWFQRSAQLKPDNLSARINLQFNERHRRGEARRLDRESVVQDLLHVWTSDPQWEAAAAANGTANEPILLFGPVDEPTFLFETAKLLFVRGEFQQATAAFARCLELDPDWQDPELGLALTYVKRGDFAEALRATEKIEAAGLPSDGPGAAQLLFCRAAALHGLDRTNEAVQCVADFVARHPQQKEVLSIAARLFARQMDYQPAPAFFEQLLRHDPANLEYLANKGMAEIQLSQYETAISTLTGALTLAPSNQVVRLNRAIARLRAGQLELAGAEYRGLLNTFPDSGKVLSGLGEIAWRKQDTNAAVRFYRKCLDDKSLDPADRRLVTQRLSQLRAPR